MVHTLARTHALRSPILCSTIIDGEPDSIEDVKLSICGAARGLKDAGYKGKGETLGVNLYYWETVNFRKEPSMQ